MIGVVSYLTFFLTITAILAIAVLGLNLQWGNAGIFNGGVVAFFGAGAYVMIILAGPDRRRRVRRLSACPGRWRSPVAPFRRPASRM